ncbi:MAG TPA: thioredoxin domain-containing protein, partial [Verrucomicrobiae bacterium]|nr:thioredoxin domain-containing protein [Verrucomicrobiae bacterium]
FFGLCTLLNQNELLQAALQVVVAGPGTPETKKLTAAVYRRSLPNRILVQTADGRSLPSDHPASGKGMIHGKAAVYLCRGNSCSLPFTDPAALDRALAAG